MIRLATQDGAPVKIYHACAGEIIAADGREVHWGDVPDLIVAHASQALQLAAYGRKTTAQRFAREATALHDAYMEARAWRSCSAPTQLPRGTQ